VLLALAAIPVIAGVVLDLLAGPASRRLAPATAVRLLVAAAGTTALATAFCLAVLAFNAVTENLAIARIGHWIPTVDPDDGTPPPIGGAALLVVIIAMLTAAIVQCARVLTATARSRLPFRHLAPNEDGVTVIESPIADAFAVPGLLGAPGRIVITRGMLQTLDPDEIRFLVAHERSHLANHHQLLVQAARLAATTNPLLVPVARRARTLTERWADEDAAARIASRGLAARTVARAALARMSSLRDGDRHGAPDRVTAEPSALNSSALNATTTGVPDRVRALSRAYQPPRLRHAWSVVAVGLAVVVASASIATLTQAKFERAASDTVTAHGRVYWVAELGDHDGDDRRR